MKKLLVLGICLVFVAMPMTTAFSQLGMTHAPKLLRHVKPALDNGTFSGMFAIKNDSGYIPIGTFNGTYVIGPNVQSGSFTGIWSLDNGTASGTLNGFIWRYVFFGHINTTESGQSHWFIGLYRVNTTDNSFVAEAIILGGNYSIIPYTIRYATGSYT
jgi:hypothetical protein